MTWSTGIGDNGTSGLAAVFVYLALIGTLVVGTRSCSSSECSEICRANGDRGDFTWTQGCYCRDEHGIYNPKDSRDRSR